jgi:hypothetical protein
MKKKLIVFCLFILWVTLLYAQEKQKKHRWSVSGFYYPEYSYHLQKYSELYYTTPWNEVMNNQFPKFGYSTGFITEYSINKWLGLKTGICYSESGYLTRPEIEYYQTKIYKQFSSLNYKSLNFPFKVSFTIINLDFFSMFCDLGIHPSAVFGFSKNYGYWTDLNQNIINYEYDQRTPISKENNKGCWSSIEFGCKYNIKRYFIGLNANFKINLVPLTDGGHIVWCKYYFYNIGGGLNLGYNI